MSITATSNKLAQSKYSTDMVRAYLLEIGRIPLLSREQEIIYSKQVCQMIALYEDKEGLAQKLGRLPNVNEWAQEVDLNEDELHSILAQGQQAKRKMIEANLRLVVFVAKKYLRRGIELLDLIQEGTLGLERGIEKFDSKQGTRLSTYVYWWIRQGVTRAISQQSRTIRLPSHIYDRLSKIKKTQKQLSHQLGRNATPVEIAQALALKTSEVRDLLLIARRPISLNLRMGENQESELVDLLKDDSLAPEEYAMGEALRHDIQQLLVELTPRQREVIILRFGLESPQAQSLQRIAEQLGLSRERVRQIEMQALTRLRRHRNRVREYIS